MAQKPKPIPLTGGYTIPRGTRPVGSKGGPTPGGGGGGKPPTAKKPAAKVISHFAATHTKKGAGAGNARALKKLYRGGDPTKKEQRQFAKAHPLFVKNNPAVARRLLGVGKKPKVVGAPAKKKGGKNAS